MPVPQDRDAVERHLLRDTAYDTLCDAIVNGTLAPGETLHDGELCAWLGLSRTPVRGALARLEDEGLVQTAPQRFTRVTPLDEADAHALFPVVAALHALATELAVPRLLPEQLRRLRHENDLHAAALAARDASAAYAADDRFHGIFVTASGNPEIARALAHVAPRLQRLERLHRGTLPGRRALAQHEAIIARAAGGDAPGAATAARENWLTCGGLVERALAQQ
ncbi:GntR family transcriptional regulator [Conexibacter stalactiti]|uniref:GntR family transcriptional regulator n=1 Tax=Conexibacter stalactiti TaxID=1940611 RepID=A0ABU4HKN8_9ACTN|nr:GntR family transcriptional regulator [Conexibacter stalactiti]MDW5593858.1 GntR family transcriptional regulator [Conexibacter stalactiti]MEC5034500.1 GntR family transcriptional regulator [Conexibacter stalactiti]